MSRPPEFPAVRAVGHARVDAVLARAQSLPRIPVAEHAGRYEELHAALVQELDAEPGPVPADPVPGGPPREAAPR